MAVAEKSTAVISKDLIHHGPTVVLEGYKFDLPGKICSICHKVVHTEDELCPSCAVSGFTLE